MSLSSVEARLPPGFRFHPRDEELVCDYLVRWLTRCSPHTTPSLIQVDLNKCEPWHLPESACVGGKEWYFYCQRDRKYATGVRTNRATLSGYWKATGKDRPVIVRGRTLVGMRKTLVFYQGRAPKGLKTDWIMHEFRLEGESEPSPSEFHSTDQLKDWVICKVFRKNISQSSSKQGFSSDPKIETPPHSSSSSPPPPSPRPPLTETADPCSNFNQFETNSYHRNKNYINHEQVPCFSTFNQFQALPIQSSPQMHTDSPAKIVNPGGGTQQSMFINPCGGGEGMIEDALNHVTRMESFRDDSCSFVVEGIWQSNLSGFELSSPWID